MKRKMFWLAGLLGCVAATVGYVHVGYAQHMTHADLAAWVQAIGSVIAILVAIAVAYYHAWAERRARLEQQKSLVDRVTLAVRFLGLAAHNLRQAAREHARQHGATDANYLNRFGSFVSNREELVLSAPVWSIEDIEVVQHLLVLQAAIGDSRHLRQDAPSRLAENLDMLVRHSRDYLKQYGAPIDQEQLAD